MTPARADGAPGLDRRDDFGEYFTYFSFFIVVSALLLAMLFFRLGVEQRLRQIGILRAAGFTVAHVRWMLLAEAALLALAGSVLGVAGAIAYAHLIVYGLRTWWVGAVGTTLLNVHVTPPSLLLGAARRGSLTALVCVLLSLRAVARQIATRAARRAVARAVRGRRIPPSAPRGAVRRVLPRSLGLCAAALGFISSGTQAGAFSARAPRC